MNQPRPRGPAIVSHGISGWAAMSRRTYRRCRPFTPFNSRTTRSNRQTEPPWISMSMQSLKQSSRWLVRIISILFISSLKQCITNTMSKDNQCNNYLVLADFMAALGACMLLSSAFLGVLLAPCNRNFSGAGPIRLFFSPSFLWGPYCSMVSIGSSRAGQKVAAPPFVRTVFM